MSSRAIVLPLSFLLFFVASRCSSYDTTAYKGHKVLAWAMDKESGEVSGFASGVVKPETTLKLEPMDGCVLTYEWGAIEAGGWMEEPTVATTIRYDGSRAQGGGSLVAPQWRFHDPRKPVSIITFISPLGTMKSAKLNAMVTGELKGTRGEIEDLAMTSLVEGGYDYDEDVKTIARIAGTLRKSDRTEEWRKLLKSPKKLVAIGAAASLMKYGDAEGTKVFCERCLAERGNLQVILVEMLAGMPQSDATLETDVKLIKSGKHFLLDFGPSVAVSDIDRQRQLVAALLQYPHEKIADHLTDILNTPGAAGKNQIQRYLDERRKNAPAGP